MNPRQNQISTVIHHQLQILCFLLLVPSDPLIAWGHLPSRRRPQQTGQYLLSTPPGAHQVAEICSYRHAVRQVVIPLDQLGPQPALAAALDHPQLQWCELPRASFQNGLWSARLAQSNAARSLRPEFLTGGRVSQPWSRRRSSSLRHSWSFNLPFARVQSNSSQTVRAISVISKPA